MQEFREKQRLGLGLIADLLGAAVEGATKIAEDVREFFSEKEEAVLTPAPSAPTTIQLYNRNISSVEVSSLCSLLNSYYRQSTVYAVDVCEIYDSIKEDLVLAVEPYVLSGVRGCGNDCEISFEAILKSSMELARQVNNPIIKGVDMLPSVNEKLEALLKRDLLDIDSPGIQRTTLAVIWSSLLLRIFSKWNSQVTSSDKRRIIKGGIALFLSVGVLFFQFCHKSPESITNYLRMLYEGYNNVRDFYNQRFERGIPDILRIQSPRGDFAHMTGQEKMTTGQVLNMVYTFRIGDMALSVLEEESLGSPITDEICKKMISSVIPVPTKKQIARIYSLYSRRHIYNIH